MRSKNVLRFALSMMTAMLIASGMLVSAFYSNSVHVNYFCDVGQGIETMRGKQARASSDLPIDIENLVVEDRSLTVNDDTQFKYRLLVGFKNGDDGNVRAWDFVVGRFDGAVLIGYESPEALDEGLEYYRQEALFAVVDGPVEINGLSSSEVSDLTEEIVPASVNDNPLSAASEISECVVNDVSQEDDRAVIALIDTGVSPACDVFARYNVIGDSPDDDNGHGTLMYETIRSQNDQAKIISIKALDENGKSSVSSVYAAIKLACELDVDVINLSFNTYAPSGNDAVTYIVKAALRNGIKVVASAGNDGDAASNYSPGNIDGVITVGALDENGEVQVFSNYGDCVGEWKVASTTSEAAAIVSGYLSRDMSKREGVDSDCHLLDYEDFQLDENVFSVNASPVKISGANTKITTMTYSGSGGKISETAVFYKKNAGDAWWGRVASSSSTSAGPWLVGSTASTVMWKNTVTQKVSSTTNTSNSEGGTASLTYNGATCYYSTSNAHFPAYTSMGTWNPAVYLGQAADTTDVAKAKLILDAISKAQTVKVAYQNADGNYGTASTVINGEKKVPWATVSWSRSQDKTYKAASLSYTAGESAQTKTVNVARKTATATVRYRLQNADGSYSSYTNGVSKETCVGGSQSYTYAQNKTYQAKSGTATIAAASSDTGSPATVTTSIDVPRKTASVTFQYRLQNADGSWPSTYTTATTTSGVRVDQSVSYTTTADSSVYVNKTRSGKVSAASSDTANPSNVTVSIDVPRKSFAINFDANGGTVSGTSSYTAAHGSSITAPSVTKPGCSLVCWVPVKSDDQKWVEVLYQEPDTTYFVNEAGAKAKNAVGAYSCLGQVPKMKKDGRWEILQTADGKAGYNQWRQASDFTSTEVSATASTAEGFEAVSLSWGASSFKGLVNKSSGGNALAAYASGNTNWWHAVGQYVVYQGGNPWIADGSFVALDPVHLYILSDTSLSNLPTTFDSGITAGSAVYAKYETQQFKALWKPASYTVVYHSSVGSGSMSNSTFTYDSPANLTSNGFTAPYGFTFLGWALSPEDAAAGIVVREDGAPHGNLSARDGDVVDLYAVWNSPEHGGYEDDETNPDEDGDGLGDNIAFSAPTNITLVMKANGNLLSPMNAAIENHSDFNIRVSSVKADVGEGWAFVASDSFSSVSANNTVTMTFGPPSDMQDVCNFLEDKSEIGSSSAWKISNNSQTAIAFSGKAKNLTAMESDFVAFHWYVKTAG